MKILLLETMVVYGLNGKLARTFLICFVRFGKVTMWNVP